jgi:hypothetical protein
VPPCKARRFRSYCPSVEAQEDIEDVTKSLPDRLFTELTADRTLAFQDAFAENPAVTFKAVLHNFVLTAFYQFPSSGSYLEIRLHTPSLPAQAPGLWEGASEASDRFAVSTHCIRAVIQIEQYRRRGRTRRAASSGTRSA